MASSISTNDLMDRMRDMPSLQLFDVRRRAAFDADPRLISGATWANPDDVDVWKTALDKRRPTVVYCAHGHAVSQGCADTLTKDGFIVHYLEGGFEKWFGEGNPLHSKP